MKYAIVTLVAVVAFATGYLVGGKVGYAKGLAANVAEEAQTLFVEWQESFKQQAAEKVVESAQEVTAEKATEFTIDKLKQLQEKYSGK